MSLRGRLLLAVVLLLAFGIIVTDVAAVTALRSQLTRQLDNQLERARDPLTRRIGPVQGNPGSTTSTNNRPTDSPGRGFGFGEFYVEIRRNDGQVQVQVPPTLRNTDDPAPAINNKVLLANADAGPFTVGGIRNEHFRYRVAVATASDGSGTVAIAAPLKNIDDTVQRLVHVEEVVTVVVMLVLILLGWLIIRSDLKPLEYMADTATAIAEGDLSLRIERDDKKTEVGRLGAALNTMLTQIEASFEERRQSADRLRRFAADASHELRTPLTAVRGYAELYRAGAITDESELKRVMRRIEDEAARMGLVVEDLLLLARMDQGRPFALVPIDFADVVSDVVNDARVIDNTRSIDYIRSADELTVDGDRARLHQIVANLVSNALQHTPSGTPVHVSIQESEGKAVVSVRDEGPGLEPEAASKVFERFFRADAGRSRDQGGAGLGLSIVQSLVEAHEGSVSVESRLGDGATFTVRIPLSSSSEESLSSLQDS